MDEQSFRNIFETANSHDPSSPCEHQLPVNEVMVYEKDSDFLIRSMPWVRVEGDCELCKQHVVVNYPHPIL